MVRGWSQDGWRLVLAGSQCNLSGGWVRGWLAMYSVAATPLVRGFVGLAKGLPLAIHRRAWFAASQCNL